MNKLSLRILISLVLATALIAAGVSAVSANNGYTISTGVAPVIPTDGSETTVIISDFSIYPSSLMPGDTGIVTFSITNTYKSTAKISTVMIREDNGIKAYMAPYQSPLGRVGPGDTVMMSVPIVAGKSSGIFFPVLYVDFDDGRSSYVKYPFAIIVDGTGPFVSMLGKTDCLKPDTRQTITFNIGNSRVNDIEGVSITVSGDGISSLENTAYIGTIPRGGNATGTLTVVTEKESKEIDVNVKYRNGGNWHTETVTLLLGSGISKTNADIIVNNIEIVSEASGYRVIGDVSNAGLTDAKGLTVTTSGAEKSGAYPIYVVGSVDVDGLSSFEVTFKNPASNTVTLILEYKDENGNIHSQTENVVLKASSSTNENNSGNAGAPIAAVLIVIVIAAALACGIIAWKKGKLFSRK